MGQKMNFIFISPQFPDTYWNFTDRLKRNGVNVLAIGDTPYEQLSWELKSSITEYYKVSDMEDYSQMFRAVAFFSFKYGKIDWLESNNEYWLETDAKLRTDFNITSGVKTDQINKFKSKYEMKKYYAAGLVPTARNEKVTSLENARLFLKKVGYPVILKPENGVGANNTYKVNNSKELDEIFPSLCGCYVIEEFINGDIVSYDAITDSKAEPVFESMTEWPPSIADIVNNELDLSYYTPALMDEKLRKVGRETLRAFDVKSRFVHLEFFRLKEEKPGLGKKGDYVALEVNMRPAGGYTPDMMNWSHSLDVYQIWADMVAFDERRHGKNGNDYFVAYASRRDKYSYRHTDSEIRERYGNRLKADGRLPQLWWAAMGNYMFTAQLNTEKEAEEFISFVTEKA